MREVSWTWFVFFELWSLGISLSMDQHKETQHEENSILRNENNIFNKLDGHAESVQA